VFRSCSSHVPKFGTRGTIVSYPLDVETRDLEKFVDDPVYDDSWPVYSPDGMFIAYTIFRHTETLQDNKGMIIKRTDKSCQWRLPFYGSFDWSPDGTKMVISANDGVYIVDLPVFLGESFMNGTGCP